MNITDFITTMIGEPQPGFEWLLYTIAGVFLLSLLQMMFDIFRGFGKMFGSQ